MVGTIVITIKKSKQNSISKDNLLLDQDKILIAKESHLAISYNLPIFVLSTYNLPDFSFFLCVFVPLILVCIFFSNVHDSQLTMRKIHNQSCPEEIGDRSPDLYFKSLSEKNTKVVWEGKVSILNITTLPLNTLVISSTKVGYVQGTNFIAFYKNSHIRVTDAGVIVQSLGEIKYVNRNQHSKLFINIIPGKLIITENNVVHKVPLI
jgi:hypothetical protein